MAKLAGYVHVADDEGYMFQFGPESDVPDWAAKKIVNPRAWEAAPQVEDLPELDDEPDQDEDDAPADEPAAPKRTRRTARKTAD
ncbi:hypothetical protein CJ179_38370 [Rhodococcus sp. ACS1]|uniref:hypothetical protein n=1 Tax=Rhodococcus sp. ACS1 TaxID=2028570 RepID=UPI000BB13B61|nr:hypothetical protein [Rhodococcus sp. ACS1]PBC38474.1 hypothetical protein CJ179_38370 [Rhodococcus sp. ACS1]